LFTSASPNCRSELERRIVGQKHLCKLLHTHAATFHICFGTLSAIDTEGPLERVEHAEASLEMLGSPRPSLLPEHVVAFGDALGNVGGGGGRQVDERAFVPMAELGNELDGVLFHRQVPDGAQSSGAIVLKRRWCVLCDGHMIVYKWKGKDKEKQWASAESLKASLSLRLCMVRPSRCSMLYDPTPALLRLPSCLAT
jgi:hypothetical protein